MKCNNEKCLKEHEWVFGSGKFCSKNVLIVEVGQRKIKRKNEILLMLNYFLKVESYVIMVVDAILIFYWLAVSIVVLSILILVKNKRKK